jgi:hypothetical protein
VSKPYLPEFTEPPTPLWLRACWRVWAEITWPVQAHRLKREGWHRTGFRQWESP